jgi:hypothetical protein
MISDLFRLDLKTSPTVAIQKLEDFKDDMIIFCVVDRLNIVHGIIGEVLFVYIEVVFLKNFML